MGLEKIPDENVIKIPGNDIVTLVVKKPKEATIDEICAAIEKNGSKITPVVPVPDATERSTDLTENPEHIENKPESKTNNPGTITNNPETITNNPGTITNNPGTITNNPGTITNNPGTITNNPGTITEEQTSKTKEDEEKKSPLPIGPYIKKGTLIGLAALLAMIIGTKEITRNTISMNSDKASIQEISDLKLFLIDGQHIQYSGSVYDDPGKLIHDMRDAAIGEKTGTRDGLERHLSTTTDEERVKEEEQILSISDQFQEQQKIIAKNEKILDSSATDDEKKNALINIINAKKEIQNIYINNQPLYEHYTSKAKEAYERNGGDERTAHEKELANLGKTKYTLSIENLGLDIKGLSTSKYVLDNPEILFEDPPAPKGTTVTNYIIPELKIGKINEVEVLETSFDPNITIDNNNTTTITNGKVMISEQAIQQTKTTRRGIIAVVDIIKRALNNEKQGDISIFGIDIHDDPHI